MYVLHIITLVLQKYYIFMFWKEQCHRLHGGLEHIATGAASDNQTQSCHFQ